VTQSVLNRLSSLWSRVSAGCLGGIRAAACGWHARFAWELWVLLPDLLRAASGVLGSALVLCKADS